MLCPLLLLDPALRAQTPTVQVTGTVVSSEDGLGLPGVSVVVKGTTVGTATDFDGNYTLRVPSDATTLVFSYIGMSTQEVDIAGRSVIDITLSPEEETIEAVVVTGYATVKKAAFTGAAATIDGGKLAHSTGSNAIRALEGNVVGMQMHNGSGQPGAPSNIYIRGRNSLNSETQPLYVIDGVPITATAQGMRSREGATFSPLATLNPNDIESVTVLKDATATSIYGSRAANGVVVVKTKQGRTGTFGANASARLGVEFMPVVPRAYRTVNAAQFEEMALEAARNELALNGDGGAMRQRLDYYIGAGPWSNADILDLLYQDHGAQRGADVNWLDEVTRVGKIQEYSLDINSGGAEEAAARYFMSLNYLDNEAMVIGKDLNRMAFRFNLEQAPARLISYGINTNIAHTRMNMGTDGGYDTDPITQAYTQTPIIPVMRADGTFNKGVRGYNPVAMRSEHGDKQLSKQTRILLAPHLTLNPLPGLSLASRMGVDAYLTDEFFYMSLLQPAGLAMNGAGENKNTSNLLITSTTTLSYVRTLAQHHSLNLMLGYEAQRNHIKQAYLSASNYAVDYLNDIALASVATSAWTDQNELILQSVFLNAQYDYQNKYYLSASYRIDGSSRFQGSNYWGAFWSVGAKYRISAEPFMESTSDWLSTLMLRASYGTTGNQNVGTTWYASRNLYDFGHDYNRRTGMGHLHFGNSDLTWEFTAKANVGLDITLFDRLHLTADYYDHQTKDMVFEVPLSLTTGVDTYSKNVGQLANSGVELSLTAHIVRTEDLDWSITLNGSHNRNRIVKLSTDLPIVGAYSIMEPGRDSYTFKMREWAGVDPQTGRGMWYKNEQGDETTFDYNEAAKRYLGSASPAFQGAMGSNLSWRGFDLSLLLTASLGGKVYGSSLRYDENQGSSWGSNAQTQWVYDNRWKQPGDKAQVPQLVAFGSNSETAHSSRYLMNGSYLKLKTISLGYSLPQSIAERIYAKSLRVHIDADNLYTIVNKDYRGFDPASVGPDGVSWWNYPNPRSIVAGLTIGF